MIGKINGQFVFSYDCPDTKYKKQRSRFILSLLGVLTGIFLLPNLAYLSSITPEKIIELTNIERSKVEAGALIPNKLLEEAAFEKANAILETQTFQHTINDKKFSSWVKETGYEYSYIGENLAIDFLTSEGAVTAWINSESHKKNLLNPRFTEIGVATVEGKFGGEDTIIIAQIFGEPAQGAKNKILGINSNISSTESTSPEKETDNKKENLLINSILGSTIGSDSNTPNSTPTSKNSSKSFIQYGYFSSMLYLLIAIISISSVLSIFCLYLFYLSCVLNAKFAEKNNFYGLKDYISSYWLYHPREGIK